MIRRILVPLDPSPYALAATQYACALARKHGAGVTGMTVLDVPEISALNLPFHKSLAPEMLRRAAERAKEAEESLTAAKEQFASICDEQGVDHSEAEFQGVPAECILDAAAYYDLLVVGMRTFYHFETRSGPGDSLGKILKDSITPVLAVPKDHKPGIEKVLVAFDGSPNAVRALRALVAFEPVFDLEVTVLMSDSDRERAEFYLKRAASYLRAHGFGDVATVATDAEIGQAIDEEYIVRSDLVVAGIHAKRQLKSFLVGSLASRLIEYHHTALLLGQ